MSGKSPEKKEEETEVVPYGELLSQVGEQMSKVVSALEKEREMAKDIRKMGGKVTRETAERIAALERQKNGLLEVYKGSLEPVRKDADLAYLEHAEYVVPKPEEIDALMADPEEIEVTDDMVIEAQTSAELAETEKGLREEADRVNEEMVALLEKMNEMKSSGAPLTPDLGDPEIRKGMIGILQSRLEDLKERSRTGTSGSTGAFGSVEAQIGLFQARYEELKQRSMIIDDPATKAEMRYIDSQLLPLQAEDISAQEARARAEADEMRQLEAQIIPMLTEDLNALGAKERAEAEEKIKAENLRAMEARFGELRNYVISINEQLKDVRTNLGFARKMDEKEGRKAA